MADAMCFMERAWVYLKWVEDCSIGLTHWCSLMVGRRLVDVEGCGPTADVDMR